MSNSTNSSNGTWHVSLHFFDSGMSPNVQQIQWRDQTIETLGLTADQLTLPFPTKFDDFIAAVNRLSGGYAEGDGSFGLVGPGGEWKISGNIFEFSDSIQYAVVIGICPEPNFLEFISQLGANRDNCAVQQLQGGFFQSIQQFFESQNNN